MAGRTAFKVGDRVKCVDGTGDNGVIEGGIYTISNPHANPLGEDMVRLSDGDLDGRIYAWRFELASVKKPRLIYISGPITGIPDHNFPAFNAAARSLRDLGFDVFNPAEHGSDGLWEDFMKRDIAELVKCDALVELPPVPSMPNSKGAALEYHIAKGLGIPCWDLSGFLKVAEFINGN